MKRISVFIAIMVLSFPAFSQHLLDIDTNKYRIRMPAYWKSGNKVWKVLTDKLPVICEEIRNKELCGDDCNPRYTMELEVLEPFVTSYDYFCTNSTSTGPTRNWVFTTRYNFQASFLLLNEKREMLARYIMVDTTETFSIRRFEEVSMQRDVTYHAVRYGNPINSITPSSLTRASGSQIYVVPQVKYIDMFDPVSYIDHHYLKLFPTDQELFNVIDQRIRNW